MHALNAATRAFEPELIHGFCRLAYLLPALLGKIPLVMSYQREISTRNVRLARWLARCPIFFTACSTQLAAKGARGGGNWLGIPNFIEPERFDFVPRVHADAPLVFLSRLDQVKGVTHAIRAARAAGLPLIIAGNRADSGPDREYFDREIEPELDGQFVKWIGPVDDTQKNQLLGAARALLVPIQWDEPFGIVFAEALACGTPVISSPRGALPEIIEPGKHGFLETSHEGLVRAIHRAGEIDRFTCRQRAELSFSRATVVGRYESVYRSMIEEGTSS